MSHKAQTQQISGANDANQYRALGMRLHCIGAIECLLEKYSSRTLFLIKGLLNGLSLGKSGTALAKSIFGMNFVGDKE
jgi:hypothetical protein